MSDATSNMRGAAGMIQVILAALCFGGCGQGERSPAPGATSQGISVPSVVTSASAQGPRRSIETAVPADIALRNFDRTWKAAEKKLQKSGKKGSTDLVAVYIAKSSRLGQVSFLPRALEQAQAVVADKPKSAMGHQTLAQALGAVHRFGEAEKALARAAELGRSDNDLRQQRGVLAMALGRYDEAYALLHEQREKFPNAVTWALEGSILGRMGKHDEADAAFAKSEAMYIKASPFVVSWILFERAGMWDRAGDVEQAKRYYRFSLQALPQHAHATGHLAALLPPTEAIPLLEGILPTSDDPEYRAMLGRLKNEQQAGSGDALIAEAQNGYDELMKAAPLAFADHAGWFYLDVAKKPDLAVEVAEKNLENRKVPEAYELLLAALLASGEKDEACRIADLAVAFKYPTRGMKRMAARAFESCGRKDDGAKLRVEVEAPRAKH